MIIAAAYENGKVFGHFGHTEQFKLYEADENKNLVKTEIIGTDGQGHGALAEFLAAHKVSVLICGGIGPGAVNALKDAGITIYAGISGSADEAVRAYLAGRLIQVSEPNCNHSDCGHEHGEGHTCGEHGCHGKKLVMPKGFSAKN